MDCGKADFMDENVLTLRQKKLLHILQEQHTYITGAAIARQLRVSPRTIRNDVAGLNESLAPFHASVSSEMSKGYLLSAANPELIQKLSRLDSAFQSRDDRVRYLSFRLVLTETPLNLFDLEDEMYISHTTLSHDLRELEKKFVFSYPQIRLIYEKNKISFENDERKKREVLNCLYREDWNYNARSNSYYDEHVFDEGVLEYTMRMVPKCLSDASVVMEDVNLVALVLDTAILYQRTKSGHPLPPGNICENADSSACGKAAGAIIRAMEEHFGCSFEPAEKNEVLTRLRAGSLMDASALSFETCRTQFSPDCISAAEDFLSEVRQTFDIDLAKDEDFFITLLQFIRNLRAENYYYNIQGNRDAEESHLISAFDISWLFNSSAKRYFGRGLSFSELLYLSYAVSGALEFLYHNTPESKLRAVIISQLNLPAIWALKRKILGAFENYIQLTALLPVNEKYTFDFSGTDLIFTTVTKKITDRNVDVLQISALIGPSDYRKIEAYIQDKRIERLCRCQAPSAAELLQSAVWHEHEKTAEFEATVKKMAGDFAAGGLIKKAFEEDILERGKSAPFANRPAVVFLHSFVPAEKTGLSVTVFEHRPVWNSYKIRVVIMAAFRKEDASLIFLLNNIFLNGSLDLEKLSRLRDKKEITDFFLT